REQTSGRRPAQTKHRTGERSEATPFTRVPDFRSTISASSVKRIPRDIPPATNVGFCRALAVELCTLCWFVLQLSPFPRQSQGEVNRFRQIIVGAQIQGLDNVLALILLPSPL